MLSICWQHPNVSRVQTYPVTYLIYPFTIKRHCQYNIQNWAPVSPPHCPQLFRPELPHLSRWQLTLQWPLPLCHIAYPVHQKETYRLVLLSVYIQHLTLLTPLYHEILVQQNEFTSLTFSCLTASSLISVEHQMESYNVSQILSFICSESCDVSPFSQNKSQKP